MPPADDEDVRSYAGQSRVRMSCCSFYCCTGDAMLCARVSITSSLCTACFARLDCFVSGRGRCNPTNGLRGPVQGHGKLSRIRDQPRLSEVRPGDDGQIRIDDLNNMAISTPRMGSCP